MATIGPFGEGAALLVRGLAKKVLLANNIGLLWSDVKATPTDELTTFLAWLGIVAFAFQLYFDFSGYSDMARGLGKMFGFDFMENFRYPYMSKSISEFWRRWQFIILEKWLPGLAAKGACRCRPYLHACGRTDRRGIFRMREPACGLAVLAGDVRFCGTRLHGRPGALLLVDEGRFLCLPGAGKANGPGTAERGRLPAGGSVGRVFRLALFQKRLQTCAAGQHRAGCSARGANVQRRVRGRTAAFSPRPGAARLLTPPLPIAYISLHKARPSSTEEEYDW
ncbi:alginate O-acetyltransferase [Brevibacillus agri BAB-2500]|nr:alginate O-acetyltransferase [Brevibacillus agri BAB-2500]